MATPDPTSPHAPRKRPSWRDRLTQRIRRRPDAIEEGLVGPEGGPAPEPTRSGKGLGLTPDDRFRSGRLAGLTMSGAIATLSLPILFESFLNSLVGLTDTWLSSQLGVEEADAIGAASYVMWFVALAFMAIGVGATAIISRAIGLGRLAVANAALGQSVLIGLSSGVLVAAAVALSAGPLASMMSLKGEAASAFTTYMRVVAAGVPCSSLLFVLTACARGAGDAMRPLWAMIVRNLVNIGASWVLSGVDVVKMTGTGDAADPVVLLANPFPFDMGIAGVAWGTVAGDLAAMLMVLSMAWRGTWGITLLRRRLVPHAMTLRRLVRLAIPNYFETLGMWLGNFFVLLMVGWMGAGLMGAHIIAIRLEALSFLPGFAMGTAAATLAGQYLGAGRPDLAKRAIWRCTLIASGFMGIFGAVFMLNPGALVGMMSPQAVHLETTPTLLVICGAVQIPFAISIVLRGAMRGAGDVNVVMALTWISTYAVRMPAAFLLSGVDIPLWGDAVLRNPMPDDCMVRGLAGLWVGLCVDLVFRGIAFGIRFAHGGWARARV